MSRSPGCRPWITTMRSTRKKRRSDSKIFVELFEGLATAPSSGDAPKLVTEIVPGVASATCQAAAASNERAAGVGTGLRSEQERGAGANEHTEREAGGEDRRRTLTLAIRLIRSR